MNQLSLTEARPEPTHREVIAAFNALDGAQIRWSEDLQEYITVDGDRYPSGTVEEVVKHLLERTAA
jgi:hypothetical protein